MRSLILTCGLFVGMASLLPFSAATGQETTEATDATTNPKITDSKLIGIDRGLDSVDYWLQKMQQGDVSKGQKLLGDLEKLAARLNRVKGADQEQQMALNRRFSALVKSIQQKSAQPNKENDAQPPQTTDQNGMSSEEAQQLADTIAKKYEQELKIPEARKLMKSGRLTADDVKSFVEGIQRLEDNIRSDIPRLRSAVAAGANDWMLKRLTGEYGIPSAIENEKKYLAKSIESRINSGYQHAKSSAGLDVQKNKYVFATTSVFNNYKTRIENTIATLENAHLIEQAFGMEPTWSPKLSEVKAFYKTFTQKAAQAMRHDELPAAVGTSEQQKIAQQVLAIEKYGVGKITKLIVNSKVVPRDRDETKWRNGKFERIVRVWKEFQVCTVEKENGKYYVYFNDLRNFSRAPNPTPIDQWILAHRWKSGEIDPSKLK